MYKFLVSRDMHYRSNPILYIPLLPISTSFILVSCGCFCSFEFLNNSFSIVIRGDSVVNTNSIESPKLNHNVPQKS